MKKIYLLFICVILGISFSTADVVAANNADTIGYAADNTEESRVIPYPAGYDLTSEGASSYNGIGNVKSSPYYSFLDFYNLQSTDTLTILSEYKTYQQTTEITCGPAAALTVLVHFGNTSWDERKVAKIMGTKPGTGTDTNGMVKFFKLIGWDVKSSLAAANKDGITFATVKDFRDFTIANLKDNTPILVENIDWGGHWRAIIGYDTMGTDTVADDILILADSYDTADHLQDGYVVNPVEKFYYMWFDAHMLPKGQQQQQWLAVKPPLLKNN
ncbi:MAG TPA: C39 family peptidase [Methylomusa anaerophila]|uniref:Peptidase C39-like domain-containing protein n=1 Tax=Methylomusa anaerophila TaxID=1930071 RepID=A0A348AEI9_9FIRM|nr:C39 family peptidase [Methylomusa anaerophila]BBB89487.1 hypothetical protein MAMMFC1_00120 [Methylomusa anaerophila]HML89718.1 C39 family peptidase [Methylomusa anaerophila]